MGKTCSRHGRVEKCLQNFCLKTCTDESTSKIQAYMEDNIKAALINQWSRDILFSVGYRHSIAFRSRDFLFIVGSTPALGPFKPPFSAMFKNEWSYTSTPQYVFMMWCLMKRRNKFQAVGEGLTAPHLQESACYEMLAGCIWFRIGSTSRLALMDAVSIRIT